VRCPPVQQLWAVHVPPAQLHVPHQRELFLPRCESPPCLVRLLPMLIAVHSRGEGEGVEVCRHTRSSLRRRQPAM